MGVKTFGVPDKKQYGRPDGMKIKRIVGNRMYNKLRRKTRKRRTDRYANSMTIHGYDFFRKGLKNAEIFEFVMTDGHQYRYKYALVEDIVDKIEKLGYVISKRPKKNKKYFIMEKENAEEQDSVKEQETEEQQGYWERLF